MSPTILFNILPISPTTSPFDFFRCRSLLFSPLQHLFTTCGRLRSHCRPSTQPNGCRNVVQVLPKTATAAAPACPNLGQIRYEIWGVSRVFNAAQIFDFVVPVPSHQLEGSFRSLVLFVRCSTLRTTDHLALPVNAPLAQLNPGSLDQNRTAQQHTTKW